MNKCLVTTLKAQTNNAALSKYNVLTIKTKASDSPIASAQWIGIGTSENGSVSINSQSVGLYKTGISGELQPYPYTVLANRYLESHFENKDGIIEVTGKYNLNKIITGHNATLRIKEIYGIPGTINRLVLRNIEEGEIDATKLSNALDIGKITDIELPADNTRVNVNIVNKLSKNRVVEFAAIEGIKSSLCVLFDNLTLDDVANNVNIKSISMFFDISGGNLSSLAKMTKLGSISFSNKVQNIGDIMDFINPWIAAGRTSGKLMTKFMKGQNGITLNSSPLTFPEGSYASDGTCYINWTSDGTVTFTAS